MITSLEIPASALDDVMLARIATELLSQPDEALRSNDEPLSPELLPLSTQSIRHRRIELATFRTLSQRENVSL